MLGNANKMSYEMSVAEQLDVLDRRIELIESGQLTFIKTGFTDLDLLMEGAILPGVMTVVAARTSHGKSAFMLNLAVNIANQVNEATKKGNKVVYVSFEDPMWLFQQRLRAIVSGVPAERIKRARLAFEEKEQVKEARKLLEHHLQIYAWDDVQDLELLENLFKANKPDVVFIDYIQSMHLTQKEKYSARVSNRNDELDYISKQLRHMAKRGQFALFMGAQLNREIMRRRGSTIFPSDIRDCGSIEQDTDVLLGLWKEDQVDKYTDKKGSIEVQVIKNKTGGATGTVNTKMLNNIRIVDVAEEERYKSGVLELHPRLRGA